MEDKIVEIKDGDTSILRIPLSLVFETRMEISFSIDGKMKIQKIWGDYPSKSFPIPIPHITPSERSLSFRVYKE